MKFTIKLFSLSGLLVLLLVCIPRSPKLQKQQINLSGTTWVSKDNPLIPMLEFKGNSTVVITELFFPVASKYERDGKYIRIDGDDGSSLLFEIVSNDSLIGRSLFLDDVWIRKK
ncbi:MAG: hypothetical protein K2O46_00345 [Bacteroidales bacterium]|nr:hypothetical protein [Bacteroidales bacterium]